MQDEVNEKTVSLCIRCGKVTANLLKAAMTKSLAKMEQEKRQQQQGQRQTKQDKEDKTYRGKQSIDKLMKQNVELSNIEITDGNIKSFERVAKKYRLDFALKKDSSTKPPTYYVFFKGQDTEMMNLAFKKYLGVQMNKKDKPSIMKKLMHFKDAVSKGKNRERAREQQKDRGQSL